MNGGNRQELLWQLFRSFFRSRTAFLTLFERYEARVLEFAEKFSIDRTRLRVSADDLLTLLDFKSLEELRDREILTLKQTAHILFRGPDATDLFDHHVSNIYHELSILKEEHYTLKEDFLRLDRKEYERFFREVAEFYPKRLRHIKNLYGKALRRLEALLPEMAGERVLIRSIFIFGDGLLEDSYRGGLTALYRKMYPGLGAAKAYAIVGESFLESGFVEEALAAYLKAKDALSRKRRKKNHEEARRHLASEVDRRIAKLERASAL
ncbi:MAG: hypothetical protein ABFS86_00565 [Planctomycetota bacterium]